MGPSRRAWAAALWLAIFVSAATGSSGGAGGSAGGPAAALGKAGGGLPHDHAPSALERASEALASAERIPIAPAVGGGASGAGGEGAGGTTVLKGGPAPNNNATNSTKQHESKKKKSDDEEKVKLGIDVASAEERQNGILRCLGAADDEVPETVKGVKPVEVGVYVLNLGAGPGGLERGAFFADFLLYLRQEGKAYSDKDPLNELAFSNAKVIDSKRKIKDGVYRIRGTFFFSPDLRWFPFDTQKLTIVLEQLIKPIFAWEFEASSSFNGMSPSVRFPGWQSSLRSKTKENRANCRTHVGFKVYPGASGSKDDKDDEEHHEDKQHNHNAFQNVTYSRFTYSLKVVRPVWQGVLMRFLPPLVMLFPTIFVFLLDPLTNTGAKASICSGSLVTIILFHSSTTAQLPPLSYLTFLDKFIFCYYITVLVALSCIVSALLLFKEADGVQAPPRPKIIEHLRKRQRWILVFTTPLTYLVFLPCWAFFSNMQVFPLAAYALALGCFIVWLVISTKKLAGGAQDELASLITPLSHDHGKMSSAEAALSKADAQGGIFSCGP